MEFLNNFLERDSNNSKGDEFIKPHKVVAFGNVLVDYTAELKNMELLDCYKFTLNMRGETDIKTITEIILEILGPGNDKVAHLGGSALNTVRILKKLGTEPLFFGAIGVDELSKELQKLLRTSCLKANNYRLQEIIDAPTGRCICLTYKGDVVLLANIGASSRFSLNYIEKAEAEGFLSFPTPLQGQQIFYIEGFFIPQREKVIKYIVSKYIAEGCHYLALNLSATYIVENNYDDIDYLIQHATFIFGNIAEFIQLRNSLRVRSLEEATDIILKNGVPKILIITEGASGGQVITNYVRGQKIPGNVLNKAFQGAPFDVILDTTGCGDAFVGAFLHYWLLEQSLDECIAYACKIAAKVAGQIGCNLP